MNEIRFEVTGRPPAKNEAQSLLGARHSHASRVIDLLRAAQAAAQATRFDGFGVRAIGLELIVACPHDRERGDATNYLGGIGDVLEDKGHRGRLDHLGDLARFGLYANDRQIEQVRYEWRPAERSAYSVRLWALED
jgi:hypothetical protein